MALPAEPVLEPGREVFAPGKKLNFLFLAYYEIRSLVYWLGASPVLKASSNYKFAGPLAPKPLVRLHRKSLFRALTGCPQPACEFVCTGYTRSFLKRKHNR